MSKFIELILPLGCTIEELTQHTYLILMFMEDGTTTDALFFSHKFRILYWHGDPSKRHSSRLSDNIRWWTGFSPMDLYRVIQCLDKGKHTNGKSPPGSPRNGDRDLDNSVLTICAKYEINSEYTAQLASAISYACRVSTVFCRHFLAYLRPKRMLCAHENKSIFSCDPNLTKYAITINLTPDHKPWLDYKWDERISGQVFKRMLLDDAMSWLNTLGGGYSALGDYFTHHAEAAAQISLRQMKIALEMGDPPTVIRCRLYFAISLMQRGYLRKAKYIIRHNYKAAQALPVEDGRLVASCHGIWSRLHFLYITRKKRGSHMST